MRPNIGMSQLKLGNIQVILLNFQNSAHVAKNILGIINTIASIWQEKSFPSLASRNRYACGQISEHTFTPNKGYCIYCIY